MAAFLVAITAFIVAHIVPPAPPVSARLVAWLGRRTYLACYSVLSTVLIVWIILAAQRAPYLPLWEAAGWQAWVPIVTMPFAAWLVIAGLMEPNPLSISLRMASPDAELGPAAAVTRHPVLWSFALWAGSHIPPNGDVVSLTLFGGMLVLALAGFAALDRRSRQRLGNERWIALSAKTSVIPFAAILSGRANVSAGSYLWLTIAAAVSVYIWFLFQGHESLIGPHPLTWLRS